MNKLYQDKNYKLLVNIRLDTYTSNRIKERIKSKTKNKIIAKLVIPQPILTISIINYFNVDHCNIIKISTHKIIPNLKEIYYI